MVKISVTILGEVFKVTFLSQNGLTSVASDTVIVVVLALLTIVTIAGLIVFLCKYVDSGGAPVRKKTTLALILVAGLVVRLVFGMLIRGDRGDYALFTDALTQIGKGGLAGYYDGDASKTLYPVTFCIYLIFGGLSNAFSLAPQSLGAQFFVKLPLIIADLLSAFAVYKIAERYFNARIALTLAAFVCVCPIFFIGSSVWTTPLAVTACLTCFGCYFLARKNYATTIAFMTAAAFSSKEGIYLFPVVAVYSIFHIVRAAVNIRRDAPRGRSILKNEYVAVITVPVGFVLSVVCAYLVGLFMIASYDPNIFKYIYEFLLAPLVDWSYFTYNGLSIYSIFNRNGQAPGARFPSGVFVGLFAAIITAVVCVVYFTKRNRATLVMLAAYSMFTMQLYYPDSSAIGMQSALILLVAAYALVKDKRLLHVLFVSGLAYVINASSALAQAGYFNNLADYYFSSADYTGSALMTGALAAIPIACSVVTVLAHLYFTVITVNIGMTGQKRMLAGSQGLAASFAEYFNMNKDKH